MANISLKLSKEKIENIKKTFKDDIKPNPNEYIDTFISRDNLTISIYKSGKVVFQGSDALYYGSSFIDTKISRQAGSDEVGTGDFFGPVCVCACIVEIEQFPLLEKLGVNDSKEINDNKIKEIAPILIKELKHSLLILENKQYNTVHEHYNLNAIKAKLHNKAYLNMLNKGYDIPNVSYVDKFCPEADYYAYLDEEKDIYRKLIFEVRAESQYPAVAVASIISRYAFLDYFDKMENKYKMQFHKGSSDTEKIDSDIQLFISKYSKNRLDEVAKLHFKNFDKYR